MTQCLYCLLVRNAYGGGVDLGEWCSHAFEVVWRAVLSSTTSQGAEDLLSSYSNYPQKRVSPDSSYRGSIYCCEANCFNKSLHSRMGSSKSRSLRSLQSCSWIPRKVQSYDAKSLSSCLMFLVTQ